jgi:hypothetical protein
MMKNNGGSAAFLPNNMASLADPTGTAGIPELSAQMHMMQNIPGADLSTNQSYMWQIGSQFDHTKQF